MISQLRVRGEANIEFKMTPTSLSEVRGPRRKIMWEGLPGAHGDEGLGV
jgi:hypothetical protein